MSKRANRTLIGGFVVGALILAVAALFVFGAGLFQRDIRRYVMFFPGSSLKGLSVGSLVTFQGVKIGEVTQISVLQNPEDHSVSIPVFIQTYPDRFGVLPSKRKKFISVYSETLEERKKGLKELFDDGMRAQLQLQSLVTGQLLINLDFHPDKPANFVGIKDLLLDKDVFEIPTIPSMTEELGRTLEKLPIKDLIKDIRQAADGINRLVNAPELMESIKAVNSAAMSAKHMMEELEIRIVPVAKRIEEAVAEYGKLAENLDGEVNPLLSSLRDTMEKVQVMVDDLDGEIGSLSPEIETTLKEVRILVRDANTELQPMAASVKETLSEYRKLAQNLDSQIAPLASSAKQTLASYEELARNIDEGKGPIASDVRKTLAAARDTMEKAQGTLAVIDGEMEGDSPMRYELHNTLNELSEMARSIRLLADYLQRHPEALISGKGKSGGR